mgnify:CR=1 FL=1
MREICLKCLRPKATCLCSYIEPIDTIIRFVILIHPMECKKVKNNTGRITHLSLKNSELIMEESFKENRRVNELISTTSSFILYPGVESKEIETINSNSKEKENITIFILDATWPCSRKMLKLSPNLQKLPKISFQTEKKSIYTFKRQPKEAYLSTIESTQVVLEKLDKAKIENIQKEKLENFLNPFKRLVELQIEYENNPNLSGYRRKNKKNA